MSKIEHNIHLLFVDKCRSFPIVTWTSKWLNSSYESIKTKNLITKCTCSIAEFIFEISALLAISILIKFEFQVNQIDKMAFDRLDRLEKAFPIFKSDDTSMFLLESKKLINRSFIPTVNMYQSLKLNIEKKLNTFKMFFTISLFNSFNYLFLISQKFIDDYLIDENLLSEEIADDYVKIYASFKQKIASGQLVINIQTFSSYLKILFYVLYFSLNAKLIKYKDCSMNEFRTCFKSVLNFIFYHENSKELFNCYLVNKFHLTKDKIDVYKEYLDVLSKQFTVQDGRSLQHVHVSRIPKLRNRN